MKRHDLLLVVGILILGIVAGILLQNSVWQAFYIAMICFMVGMPFLLIASILTVVYSRKIRFESWSRHLVLIVSALTLSIAMMVITMGLINRWKIKAVEGYVVRAVPVLDRIKGQSGEYPSRLPIALVGEPPSLLRDHGTYTATATSFRFEYVNEPTGWAGGEGALKFDSSTRRWSADRGDQK